MSRGKLGCAPHECCRSQWRSQKFQLGGTLSPFPFSPFLFIPSSSSFFPLFSPLSFFLCFPLLFPLPSLRSRTAYVKSSYGLGERCELPQRGLHRSPSRNRIECILAIKISGRLGGLGPPCLYATGRNVGPTYMWDDWHRAMSQ